MNNSKKCILKIFTALALFFLLFAYTGQNTAFAASSTPYSQNGQLSISKGKVVNKKGKTFIIKGVSTHGIAWFPQYVNEASFKTLRDKFGVNTIRLALYTAEYNGYCTGGNQKKLEQLIDNGVKYAKKLGMYVIIDWHILSDGNPRIYESKANTFFKKTAKKYAGYGNVIYEICNEPNGSGGSWTNIRNYASKIVKTIRSVDKKSIIIVGTPTWSQEVKYPVSKPVTGYKNIAYSFHFYAGTHKASMRSQLEYALKKKLPVIVTEFGISEASGNGGVNTSEGSKWMTLLNKCQVGRVCWNLSNKSESSAIIKSSCKKTSGWGSSDLTSTGKFILKAYTGNSSVKASSSSSNSSSSNSNTSAAKPVSSSSNNSSTIKASINVSKTGGWMEGKYYISQYKMIIKNTGGNTFNNWKATVSLKESFSLSQYWCANIKKSGNTITVTPLSWNKKVTKNNSIEIGFIIKSSKKEQLSSTKVNVYK